MHWPIQAAVLILCIVTCAAQGRGARRFSSSTPSVQEAIAEEDVLVKNHRFQSRHGTRTETRDRDVSVGRGEYPTRQLQQQSRQEPVSELAPTRRSITSRVDNDIPRTGSRIQSRQRTEGPTTRQYLSRNSRPNDNVASAPRRRIDVDISTEEVVTKGNSRTRNEKIRGVYSSRVTIEQEVTTSATQYRGRNIQTREKDQQEKPTSQTRSRNVNSRQSETNQSRTGRGRSLSLEEPTTQSLRPRGRGHEKAVISDTKSTGSRINDFPKSNRANEPVRSVSSRTNGQRINENAVKSRGRNVVRGKINSRTEAPVQTAETLSTKQVEELPFSSSSETPLEAAIQDQSSNVDVTQGLDLPLMQLLEGVSSEEVPSEQSTRKLNGNPITSEPTASSNEEKERIKEATTVKLSTERPSRTLVRTGIRKLPNARFNNGRNGNTKVDSNNANEDLEYETATRSSRRNAQRFTPRPSAGSTQATVEKPHHGGRGRSRELNTRTESIRNGRTETEVTTANNRVRNNLYHNNLYKSRTQQLEEQTQTENNQPIIGQDKRISEELPTAVESEVNKLFSSDAYIPSATVRQTVTSDSPVTNVLGRKVGGRGTARASKTEVISCTCFSKSACNFVHCPHIL